MMQRQQQQALLQGRRLLQQQQTQNQVKVQCSRRRLLSSPSIVRQPMTAPPSQPPLVVSRRAWQAHRKTHPVVKKDPSKDSSKNTSTDDMPWPKSVVYGSYVAAATLIPYFSAWFVANNPAAREMVATVIPNVQDHLRGHFGKPDVDALSYSDVVGEEGSDNSKGEAVPYILINECTIKVRREQEAIQALMSAPVNVKIQVVDDSSVTEDVRVQKVPGSTPARLDTLLALITSPSSTSSLSSTSYSASKLPSVGVDFLPDDDDNNGDNDTNATSFSSESSSSLQSMDSTEWSNSTGMTTDSATTLSSLGKTRTVDPLQQTAHIFSSWHYQPPANVPNTSDNSNSNKSNKNANKGNNTSSASVSMDDIEKSRLEYAIAELQWNLKDPNCLRSVDDMMDELNGHKAELSRLKWNKWVSWK